VCTIRTVGNTVPAKISILFDFIIPYCRYMFRSLSDHLQEEYPIPNNFSNPKLYVPPENGQIEGETCISSRE
jgi:hypothetical protein